MRKKKITIEVNSTEDNERIETYAKLWVGDNFQDYKNAKIQIEDLGEVEVKDLPKEEKKEEVEKAHEQEKLSKN